jgi:hypothetical protein
MEERCYFISGLATTYILYNNVSVWHDASFTQRIDWTVQDPRKSCVWHMTSPEVYVRSTKSMGHARKHAPQPAAYRDVMEFFVKDTHVVRQLRRKTCMQLDLVGERPCHPAKRNTKWGNRNSFFLGASIL